MRQWPHDPTVAHLVFVDHLDTPTEEELAHAVDHARRRGARAMRTSALFPRARDVALACGFHVLDELALLQRDLTNPAPPPNRPTLPMRAWHHRAAAELDRVAFGPTWGNDADSLRDIRAATPQHRARRLIEDRDLAGFAISGAAGDNGYVQRLAVAPRHRRRGVARTLVLDSLAWMHRRGLTSALVNTGTMNHGALALYDGLGFAPTNEVLTIAEILLDG